MATIEQFAGARWRHEAVSVRCNDATRMFGNVQTLSIGMGMLIIGLAPLIALGLERYYQEGHEHG
jgi:hypothetical protein